MWDLATIIRMNKRTSKKKESSEKNDNPREEKRDAEIEPGIAPHHIKAIGLEHRRPGFVCSHIIMRDGTKHVLTGVNARKALNG